ncbi:MAG: 30S ribosomal protein S16, partial [Alphaproteobacteria bacterium]|nr:30S ribosomal protein S16 [Alphaproteobacteria bacterium]
LLPSDHPERVVLREERIRHWLGAGALPSDRVCRFLDAAGITENTVKHRGTGKRAEEIAAKKAEAEAAAAEAAAEAAKAEKAAAPAEDAPPAEDEAASADDAGEAEASS